MIENKEELILKDMPEDEAVEIFKEWFSGANLEIYDYSEGWRRPSNWGNINRNGIYRIPARPPRFNNWHLLPEWARFIAQDENGCASIFESEPTKVVNCWDATEGRDINITGFRLGYDPGTGGWENSMIEKPEVK